MPAPKSKFSKERLFFIEDSFQERKFSNIETYQTSQNDTSQMSDSETEQTSPNETVQISQTLEVAKNCENRDEQSKKRKFNSSKDQLIEEFQKSRQLRNDLLKPISGIKCNEESPTHKFFNSMADIVSTFPGHRIAEIRMKVCNLVSEMELLIIAENSERPTTSPRVKKHQL